MSCLSLKLASLTVRPLWEPLCQGALPEHPKLLTSSARKLRPAEQMATGPDSEGTLWGSSHPNPCPGASPPPSFSLQSVLCSDTLPRWVPTRFWALLGGWFFVGSIHYPEPRSPCSVGVPPPAGFLGVSLTWTKWEAPHYPFPRRLSQSPLRMNAAFQKQKQKKKKAETATSDSSIGHSKETAFPFIYRCWDWHRTST